MGKNVPARKSFRSKIYSHIENAGSHIDNVKNSLERLVFSNEKEIERALFKKRLKVVVIVTLLLMVFGSLISPKGNAEVAVFYPTSCLGGWSNPQNAEGEPRVKSNEDESLFTKDNSAILPTTTNADIYCGNFVGEIEENTKPVKILVSFSWSKGENVALEQNIKGDSFASSSEEILDIASTTEVSFTLSSSTEVSASSSEESANFDINATSTDGESENTSIIEQVVDIVSKAIEKVTGSENGEASSTPATPAITPEVNQIDTQPIENVPTSSGTVDTETSKAQEETTPAQSETPPTTEETPPTSYFKKIIEKLSRNFIGTAFAQEGTTTSESVEEITVIEENNTTIEQVLESTSTEIQPVTEIVPLETEETSNDVANTTELSREELIEIITNSSSTEIIESSTTENQSTSTQTLLESAIELMTVPNISIEQDSILEVFYTFDGVTWNSLGKVNETSMRYRTFEIPVDKISSWNDMGQLQIKIQQVQGVDQTPTIYLDGIKVEVLYETPVIHEHPDFSRDTLLKDETLNGVRIVTIINSDTGLEEIWYMYLDDNSTSTIENTTATGAMSTSTSSYEIDLGTSTQPILDLSSTTEKELNASSTEITNASSSSFIRDIVEKNKWFKFESNNDDLPIGLLIEEIDKEQIELEKEKEPPNFSVDTIKKIKGAFLQAVIVQIERENKNDLWLYDVENSTEEKITASSTVSVSRTFPLGIKGEYLFWLSEDESILYAYSLNTKTLQEKTVPSFDPSKGERAEIKFDEIPWDVIVNGGGFSFYSRETGEVFSDEDSSVLDEMRKKFNLDAILNEEKLNELDFSIESTNEDVSDTNQ